jgi:hypothetical protein
VRISQFVLTWNCEYRTIDAMSSAARRIIEAFGGEAAVARAVGVHLSRVYRWTYPPARGGSGGRVPQRHHQRILTLARERGLALSAADLVEHEAGDGG